MVGRSIWKGFLLFLCVSLCIAGFSSFFSGDTKSLLPSVIFLGLTIFMLRKPLAALIERLKRRPGPSRPLAAKEKETARPKAPAAVREKPETLHVYTQRAEPEEDLSLDSAELSYLDVTALKYWDGKPTDFELPGYYSESAFGRNAGPALRRLLAGGFLAIGDIRRSIRQKTVPDLKAILSERGLKVSGKKDELVQRLMDNLPGQELRELFPVGVYEITPAGERALAEYAIIFENEDYQLGFSYYRLIQEKSKHPASSDESILFRLLNENIQECYRTGNRSKYQLIIPNAARYAMGHGEPDVALDLSILAYFVWTRDLETLRVQATPPSNDYLAKHIEEYGKLCGLSFSQVLDRFRDVIMKNNPFGLGTKKNVESAVGLLKAGLGVS